MTIRLLLLAAAVPLAGCGTMGDVKEELAHAGGRAPCDATDVQPLVGQKADVAMMERLMQATGAEAFRWAPPDSAMTMDYRPDRLTVAYDRDMAITRISCG